MPQFLICPGCFLEVDTPQHVHAKLTFPQRIPLNYDSPVPVFGTFTKETFTSVWVKAPDLQTAIQVVRSLPKMEPLK